MMDWYSPIKEPVVAMAIKIWSYVPNVIASVVILFLGLVISKIAARIVVKVLRLSKLDVASEKSGLANMLKAGEIKTNLSEIIGTIVYWLLILVVAATAAQALKFTAAVDLMTRLIGYIPNIIAAILILAIGAFVASILGSLVLTASRNAGIKKANLLTQIVKISLNVFAVGIALEQLQIGAGLVTQAINIILISVGAGFALAFGLGSKDLVGKWFSDFINSMK